jgi:CheY-like chemotaxis protein
MRVLIAEDNETMREMIKSLLGEPGTDVFECADGDAAVEMYDQLHPDCVLMDVEMEPMDGITATRKIKAAHPEARIVIVTNYGDRRTREAAEKAGADEFVDKENLLDIKDLMARGS